MLSESVAHGRKNIRRSRACKARNEAQKKIFSGRSGFIGDGAKRFAGPFVTLLRSRTMRLSAGGAASRTHGISPFQKQSARISDSGIFFRQCVGGDGHPVGVRRHLNDPWIYEPAQKFFKRKGHKKNSLLRRDLLRKPIAPIVRIAAVMLESQNAVVDRKWETRHQISPHPSLDDAPTLRSIQDGTQGGSAASRNFPPSEGTRYS